MIWRHPVIELTLPESGPFQTALIESTRLSCLISESAHDPPFGQALSASMGWLLNAVLAKQQGA